MNVSFKSLSLIQNGAVQVREGKLCKCSRFEQIKRFFSPGYDKKEIQAVADHIFKNLQGSKKNDPSLLLANAFVVRYENTFNGRNISQAFDRVVAQYRQQKNFFHKDNEENLNRWIRYNQNVFLYKNYPEFCTFIETSGLLSKIKITRDTFMVINGEPSIKVNGEWMNWLNFKSQFKNIYSKRYRETFIVDRQNQVYTYLDNGKGLQPHHPFLSEKSPISQLNDLEYAKVLEKAQSFIRVGEEVLSSEKRNELNKERTFVIQVVTSYVKGPTTRFHELIINPKHPYTRLIIGRDDPNFNRLKGQVYEVGYGWKNKLIPPLSSSQGRFRSPDLWNYKSCEKRFVTNIAVTPEEAQAFSDYLSEYHLSEVNIGNPVAFHLFKQNCSTFVRAALDSANIQVPTKASFAELLHEVMPLAIIEANEIIQTAIFDMLSLGKHLITALPSWVTTPLKNFALKIEYVVKQVMTTLTAVIFIPLKIALGDAFGKGGRAFVRQGDKQKHIEPTLHFKRWFSLSNYSSNLPGILQRWQRKQVSTVVYENPVKLCIVP